MRTTPLPTAPARGRLIASKQILQRTLHLLQRPGGVSGPHEGIVLWAGRSTGQDRLAVAPVAVPAHTGAGHVRVDAQTVGRAGRTIRAYGLALVAQVHSHPGDDTRHSDGDDTLIVMTHEGMWSLICGHYGAIETNSLQHLGVHQRQGGRWVAVDDVAESFLVIPDTIEVP